MEIYFEKENIWTLDSKGELLITIMSSLAQDESRNISENVTWRHRKRFAAGKNLWRYMTVRNILTNEKYKGDALLQKVYTVDFITHWLRMPWAASARKITPTGIRCW